MAITGTGTKDDPYIVHSYDELKEKYTKQDSSTTNCYIKLANDIDCNDFGDSWEWTAMERVYDSGSGNKYIDLDNHTIKNIMIKSGGSLFSDNIGSTHISNGKILNVFNSGARTILENVRLNNISISVNGTNITFKAFYNVVFEKCAVYFKSNKLNNSVFYGNIYPYCKYSDFYLEINDKNERPIFENYALGSETMTDCRVRGYVRGKSKNYYLVYGGTCANSVIEMDTTNMTWDSTSSSRQPFYYQDKSTGIINTEISPNLDNTGSLTACTTAQMRDPDYLNSIGFVVAKVGE